MDSATDLKLETHSIKDLVLLKMCGNLDADSMVAFKKITYPMVEKGSFKFILDFEKLNFIDSMGLGALISLLRRVRNLGGDVKISGPNKDVRTIFEITRLHRLFEIYPDWEAACKSF